MTGLLALSHLPGETRAAWVEDGNLRDLIIQRADLAGQVGDIYLGRIAALRPELGGAFVELGLAKQGFLAFDHCVEKPVEGAAILVAVLRAASADKGVKLSARRVVGDAAMWELAHRTKPPALVVAADDPIDRAMGAADPPTQIVIDDFAFFKHTKLRLAGKPAQTDRLRFEPGPLPLFESLGIQAEFEALLQARVALASGAQLWIEPVRALTAIDVDSGSGRLRGAPGAGALSLNLEAAREIARQIHLRGLSGLIVVDFLDLEAKVERRQLVEALRQALAMDPNPCQVSAMRGSGIVEITRQRSRPPLHEIFFEAIGSYGSGWERNPISLAFDALRAYRAAALATPSRAPVLHATPRVLVALGDQAEPARLSIERALARPIKTCPIAEARLENYEIL